MINWADAGQKISKYFTVKEAIWLPQWNRLANDTELTEISKENLGILFSKMDAIRDFFAAPVMVHVTLRPEEYNKLVGGAKASAHLIGKACDFHVKGVVCDDGRKRILDAGLLDSLELRMEDKPGSNWIHLDFASPTPHRYFIP